MLCNWLKVTQPVSSRALLKFKLPGSRGLKLSLSSFNPSFIFSHPNL